jgi:DNA-binding GntR family transcriptional regulator
MIVGKIAPVDANLSVMHGNSDDVAYTRLREAILSGQLLPNERIIEADLANSLGVGRTSLRTAVARLAQERLLERVPNRGARVRRISDREAAEMREVRSALECVAVRHAAAKATDEDIKRLQSIIAEMYASAQKHDFPAFTATNARFHGEILRISGHETAAHLIEVLRSRNTRFQSSGLLTPPQPVFRYEQHRDIADAIAARDPDAAEAAMRLHLSDVSGRM